MRYALIENEKVKNIIALHPKNEADFPSAVRLNDIHAAIGDDYIDGVFYRNGERILSESEKATDIENALAILLGGEG